MNQEINNWENYKEEKDNRLNLFFLLKKNVARPNREGLKILQGITSHYMPFYPKQFIRDSQKFKYLKTQYVENKITKETFIEFSKVLEIQKNLLKKTLQKLEADKIKW